ncbi:hypothetical protein NVP1262O_61 [Vibrio phage 1.262.O._10N.286.51.A9]|nr:hypothetical protein NVP1262O_61 [Vibrio phage 1.262.O._10N.286.51.A9]
MWAYKNGSVSAKALAEELGIKKLRHKGSKWNGKNGDVILNWGNSNPFPNVNGAKYTNSPEAVAVSCNKLKTHELLWAKPYNLPYTVDIDVAKAWINEGYTVVCRQRLTGHSGAGIVIANGLDELVGAPLYTIYKKKTEEYRIHVFDGEVLDVQKKARKHDVPDEQVNWQVRNLDGGFIFARQGVVAHDSVLDSAVDAVRTLGLLHGAVDIGYHKNEGTYVYEINTACGLMGTTLQLYANAFRRYFGLAEVVYEKENT